MHQGLAEALLQVGGHRKISRLHNGPGVRKRLLSVYLFVHAAEHAGVRAG